jgi:CheY-like chemotaxis protein
LDNKVSGSKEKYRVLLVDDSDADRYFLRRALRDNERLGVVAEVEDGDEAIAYLRGDGRFNDRQKFPFPDLVILDLKMPRITGYEVLEWLQTQSFDELRVAVLSGSFLQEDMARTLKLGADAFHTKSTLDLEQTVLVGKLEALFDGEQ